MVAGGSAGRRVGYSKMICSCGAQGSWEWGIGNKGIGNRNR